MAADLQDFYLEISNLRKSVTLLEAQIKSLPPPKHPNWDAPCIPGRERRLRWLQRSLWIYKLWFPQRCKKAYFLLVRAALHVLRFGAPEDRNPYPLFDAEYYLRNNPEAAASRVPPLLHFLLFGGDGMHDPHPLFDIAFYNRQYPEISKLGINPLVHYLEYGARAGCNPNPVFDSQYYLSRYPDVASSGVNPLIHYALYGAEERRNPHPLFDSRWYADNTPGTASELSDPLAHYLTRGAAETRSPHPWFDARYYLELHPEAAQSGVTPLEHYLQTGAAAGYDPHTQFDTRDYLHKHPDVVRYGLNPLVHFVLSNDGQPPLPENLLAVSLTPSMRDQGMQLREDLAAAKRAPLDDSFHSEPLVSVIIPCYNHGRFLENAIVSSLLACTQPMEIVVVDDGSTQPESVRLIDELTARYRCLLVRQENGGLHAARRAGLAKARGTYIQLLDADDVLAAGKIDIQLHDFAAGAVDIALCDYEMLDAPCNRRFRIHTSTLAGFEFTQKDFLEYWERGLSVPIHCALFHRRILERVTFRTVTRRRKEDWIFWVEMAAAGARFHYRPEYLVTYSLHGDRSGASREEMGTDFLLSACYIETHGLAAPCSNFLVSAIRHHGKTYAISMPDRAQWCT